MGRWQRGALPSLSERAHLMFVPVIAASVRLKSTWEVGMGGVRSEINVSCYENLIQLFLG